MIKRMSPGLITIGLALSGVAGCETSIVPKPISEMPPIVFGIWESDGYGYIIDATGDFVRLYHKTSEFCIEDIATGGLLAYYLTSDNLTYDPKERTLFFSNTFDLHKIELNSIEALPELCNQRPSNSPQVVFNSFASYMREHYAFFDLYGVDWEATVQKARLEIRSDTTDAELFDLFSEMLSPMSDGHLKLVGSVKGKEKKFEPGLGSVDIALRQMAAREGAFYEKLVGKFQYQYWLKDIRKTILGGEGKMVANDMIQYGLIGSDIGYIAVAVEAGYADKGEGFEKDDRTILTAALDDAIDSFTLHNVKGVIIDLSINFGGHDYAARDIVSRFADRRILAYSKHAVDADNQKPTPIYIEPASGSRYTGPVYLLTSNITVSAGEMITMGLRALPNVTHIGEATRGAHSDSLEKLLPNGWRLSLSNEIYTDHEGNFWEKRGIEPQISIEVFDRNNPFFGHVEAVEQVTKLARSKS